MHGEWFSKRYSEKFNIPIEELKDFFDNEFQECELGRKDLKEVILPYLPKWKWAGTIDELLHFWFAESYRLDDEAINLLKKNKNLGKILVLATNQEKYRVDFMKNEMGLEKVFDFVISSHETGCFKDNPEFYKQIFKLLPEIKPSEILFFDDREKNIKAAESVGIKAKLYKNLNDLKECL